MGNKIIERWEEVKKAIELIGWQYNVLTVGLLGGAFFAPITTSKTLQLFITIAATIAIVMGYYFTVTEWRGQPKYKRLRRRRIYFVFFWCALIISVIELSILKPNIADTNDVLLKIFEFMHEAPLIANILISGSIGLVFYSITSAVIISSPKLQIKKISGDTSTHEDRLDEEEGKAL